MLFCHLIPCESGFNHKLVVDLKGIETYQICLNDDFSTAKIASMATMLHSVQLLLELG